jgi:PAS domain S-box-containing protein
LRGRQIAPAVLVLALTVASFIVAGILTRADARRGSERRAEVAAAQIHGRIAQGASLTESLRRFMLDAGGTGVTSPQFARNALRWLSPANFPAAAWVEEVPESRRAAYERRLGEPIVTADAQRSPLPPGSRSGYLPATLVSGFHPMAVPGIDLSHEPGIVTALRRADRINGVVATPPEATRIGTGGLFLVAPAPNLVGEVLRPGHVVVFLSDVTLRAAAGNAPGVRLVAGGTAGHAGVRATFTEAGRRFTVVVPEGQVGGPAAVLPWLILAAGLSLACLALALGFNAARRSAAQEELDRLFALTPDLVTVADFEGRFTRVSPAVKQILGYTEEEFLTRPYLEFVHPDDRDRTASEAAAISDGKTSLSFENRYRTRDGGYRTIEWTARPVVDQGVMYAVGRDVTERRRAEREVERLAEEQAALRRVTTLVAEGGAPTAVFDAVAAEMERLLDAEAVTLGRYEPGNEVTVVAARGHGGRQLPIGLRASHAGNNVSTTVRRTGRPARVMHNGQADTDIGHALDELNVGPAVGAPVVVDGRVWGVIVASWTIGAEPPSAATEHRMVEFAGLLGTATANADSRDQLTASRARLLTEADEARRRVVRDLHDGAQQRFVHSIVTLKLALQTFARGNGDAQPLIVEALEQAERGTAELRELAHGILPLVLTRGGLPAAIRLLVSRLDLAVRVDVADARFPAEIEASAYFIIAEALTNVVKHARAEHVNVTVARAGAALLLEIRDDGIGGAARSGHGLVGMSDRVTALGGSLEIESPAGGGTRVTVSLPLAGP